MFKVAILQKRAINAQIDKNIESIIMAMKEASENHADILLLQNALLQDMICLCHMKKALQMMISELPKYARVRKNIK